MNVPNLITLARLVSVPIAVWFIMRDHMVVAFWLFVAAGISDAVDGFIAKRFNARTVLGSFLDPLADKALLVSVYITLGNVDHLESWLVLLVVSRDIMIIGGVVLMFMLTGNYKVEPSLASKINTTAQIMLAALVMAVVGYELRDFNSVLILTYLVAATTIISGAGYMVNWVRKLASMENSR